MNAAIPSTTNARMTRQTSTIATAVPADIVVMSIVMNCFLKCGPSGTSTLNGAEVACERRGSRSHSPVDEAYLETYRRSWLAALEEAMRLS
jgi:hypothetical protein